MEIQMLKERLETIQSAWHATKSEMEQEKLKYNEYDAKFKSFEYDTLYATGCLKSFKEQVSTLLSDGFVRVEPNEEDIKEKLKQLMTSSKDRGLMLASMEAQITKLKTELTTQTAYCRELEIKSERNEGRCMELEGRLKSLDSEFCAHEVLRDNLKSDRVKYLAFLERLGNVLKVTEISADIGIDMNVDIILARAEQLVRMEGDGIHDKQTNIYNLQRKIKSLKEQVDNKELHLDLLRKKLAALEEEKAGKNALEREVDDHVMISKKLKIKVERLTEQLNSLKCENSELKAKYQETCSRCQCNELDKEKHRLVETIRDLESSKEKFSIKFGKLRSELEAARSEINKLRKSSDGAVDSLSVELRSMRQDYDKICSREKQVNILF
jgi:chromosome segregation ATPase